MIEIVLFFSAILGTMYFFPNDFEDNSDLFC